MGTALLETSPNTPWISLCGNTVSKNRISKLQFLFFFLSLKHLNVDVKKFISKNSAYKVTAVMKSC